MTKTIEQKLDRIISLLVDIKLNTDKPKKRKLNPDGPQPGTLVKKAFCESYRAKYEIDYPWAMADTVKAKKLCEMVGVDEAVQLAMSYPTYKDMWHEKQKHPFALLVSQLNKVKIELLSQVKEIQKQAIHKRVIANIPKCEKCDNLGRVHKDINKSSYTFKCDCPFGQSNNGSQFQTVPGR